VIESEELGSEQFVAINVVNGYLNTVDEWGYGSSYSNGYDMVATINGMRATAQGNNISINTPDLAVSMNVGNAPGWTGFTITGGGALFQLGPDVVSQQQVRVGIGSMLSTNLGGNSGKLYMLKSGNIAALTSDDNGRKLADRIVMDAIQNVASTRGRLGALQKGTLEPNIDARQDSMVALTEANAMITNADFAVESSNLMRLQLLIQAGAQTLGIANQLPQYAASLVR
jgi:flagellin